jgi:hypothetical protein
MRHHTQPLAFVIALGLVAACSRHDDAKVAADLKGAGHDVDSAAANVSHDQDVRAAEAQFRAAGRDAGQDFRKAAAEARAAARALAADTRHAAHDVTHSNARDERDQRDSSS